MFLVYAFCVYTLYVYVFFVVCVCVCVCVWVWVCGVVGGRLGLGLRVGNEVGVASCHAQPYHWLTRCVWASMPRSRCCRALRRADDFYCVLGALQWGADFWSEAFQRPTRQRVYRGMRHELRRMHAHARVLERLRMPAWTHADYRTWWRSEARFLQQSYHHQNGAAAAGATASRCS